MIKTIVFDYDGTLHNSSGIYCKAFYEVQKYFVDRNYIEYKEYSIDDVMKWLGVTPIEMWNEFAPNLSDELKELGSSMIGRKMNGMIAEAQLYDGSTQMLKDLKGRVNLIFLSNCMQSYMHNHIRRFKLDKYFDDFYCAQDYKYIPKYKIFEQIKSKYEGEYIVVGDRYKDIEIKNYHNVITIGCCYGYGRDELAKADYKVASIMELNNTIVWLVGT